MWKKKVYVCEVWEAGHVVEVERGWEDVEEQST